jgi:hypothetical protein
MNQAMLLVSLTSSTVAVYVIWAAIDSRLVRRSQRRPPRGAG